MNSKPLAELVLAPAAGGADPAWTLRVDDHGIAAREVHDSRAQCMDPAGCLVSEDGRQRLGQIGEHAVGKMEVCPAEARRPDPNDDVIGAGNDRFVDLLDDRLPARTRAAARPSCRSLLGSERCRARVGDVLVLFDAAAADPNRARGPRRHGSAARRRRRSRSGRPRRRRNRTAIDPAASSPVRIFEGSPNEAAVNALFAETFSVPKGAASIRLWDRGRDRRRRRP